MFVTCACILVGHWWVQGNQIAITISSFLRAPPCKEIAWLCCALRALRGSKSDPSKCLWRVLAFSLGIDGCKGTKFPITISSFKRGPPCKEITWLHGKPTCSVFFCMLFYVFPLSPFSSSSFCRLRAYLLVVTPSVFLIVLLPLSRTVLENAPPRIILEGICWFFNSEYYVSFRSARFLLFILISQDRGILIFLFLCVSSFSF